MKIPEIPISNDDLMLAVLWPALVACVILGASALLPERRRGWAGPVAMAGAFVAAYPLINGAMPRLPPNNALDWLFCLALPVGMIAGVAGAMRVGTTARACIATIVFAGVLWVVMQPAMASRSTGDWWVLWTILLVVLSFVFWFVDRAVATDQSLISCAGLVGILLGACVLIQMSGSLKWALQGGAMVAGLAVVVALIAAGLPRGEAAGVPLVSVGVVGVLLAISIEPLFVNVRIINALLIAASGPMLWLATLIQLPHSRPWLRCTVKLALPALPVLVALSIAGAKAIADLNHTGSDEYYGY